MARVYSSQFLASHQDGGGSFQCPAGYRAVLRFVTLFNSDASGSRTAHLIHRESDCTILQWEVAPQVALSGNASVQIDMRFVFVEGDHIDAVNDLTIDMTLSGYLLTLP